MRYCGVPEKNLSVSTTASNMKRLGVIFLLCTFTTRDIQAETNTTAVPPTIISRSQWGAPPPKTTPEPLKTNPAPFVVIHHSDTRGCRSRDVCETLVASFQNHHMYKRGWNDIGYNFIIGEDGNVYEGRGWGITGAHSPNYNDRSLGICFIGNFDERAPDSVALEAGKKLLEYALASGKLTNDYRLIGHQQLRMTTCPGRTLYGLIKSWPHWEPYFDIQL